MVEICREAWRVLRPDGTMWMNLGDSYAQGNKGNGGETRPWEKQSSNRGSLDTRRGPSLGPNRTGGTTGFCKLKDLVGIPWFVAFSLRSDGWYLRRDIIWSKPNPMPESVEDRPTTTHEYIFLFSKQTVYFYDHDAIKEPNASGPSDMKKMAEQRPRIGGKTLTAGDARYSANQSTNIGKKRGVGDPTGRNARSVWTISTTPFPGAHFAVFPKEIPRRCISAGTSDRGACAKCGAAWERIVERENPGHSASTGSSYEEGTTANRLALLRQAARARGEEFVNRSRTVGWRPSCECGGYSVLSIKRAVHLREERRAEDVMPDQEEQFPLFGGPPAERKTAGEFRRRVSEARLREYRRRWQERVDSRWPERVPCRVLDFCAGSGTTGEVAISMARAAVLIEPKAEYVEMIEGRCTTTIGLPLQ